MLDQEDGILVLSAAEVHRALDMATCIDVMAGTLAALAREEAVNPLRSVLHLPDPGQLLALMPAALGAGRAFGTKVISVVPANRAAGLDSHQGFVVLFEPGHGRPTAIVDAGAITALRTAAVSGVATRVLAGDDARVLALLGSGTQARTHLSAMLAVRPIQSVRAWSPHRDRLQAFVDDASAAHGVAVVAAGSAREAVAGADIVCTVTASTEPVLHGDWLAPGAHVNAVGSSTPTARELDAAAVQRARLYVDRRESALHESGDLLAAIRDGAVAEDHIVGEIGEVLTGAVPGRQSEREVTLFKSLGLAVEDVAAAEAAVDRATQVGIGRQVTVE